MLAATWKKGGIMTLSFFCLALCRVSEKPIVKQNRLRKEDLKENHASSKPSILLKEVQCVVSFGPLPSREMGTPPTLQGPRCTGDTDPGLAREQER